MTELGTPKWCYWQVECLDFKGYACMASAAEARVFECTYNKDGQYTRGKPRHPRGGGLCEDFRVSEEFLEQYEIAMRLKEE
jgi:hypothetical protein